jgi:hypothetical protein
MDPFAQYKKQLALSDKKFQQEKSKGVWRKEEIEAKAKEEKAQKEKHDREWYSDAWEVKRMWEGTEVKIVVGISQVNGGPHQLSAEVFLKNGKFSYEEFKPNREKAIEKFEKIKRLVGGINKAGLIVKSKHSKWISFQ